MRFQKEYVTCSMENQECIETKVIMSDRKIERRYTNDRGYVGRTSRLNRRGTSGTLTLSSAQEPVRGVRLSV